MLKKNSNFLFVSVIILINLLMFTVYIFISPENLFLPSNLNKTVKAIVYLLIVLAPLFVVCLRYMYSNILIHVFSITNIKKTDLFKLSTISYIPVLIGTLFNLILSFLFGVQKDSYLSLNSFITSNSRLINLIYLKLNPFELASIVLFSYLFTKKINGTKKDFFIFIVIWYIVDCLINYFFSKN